MQNKQLAVEFLLSLKVFLIDLSMTVFRFRDFFFKLISPRTAPTCLAPYVVTMMMLTVNILSAYT